MHETFYSSYHFPWPSCLLARTSFFSHQMACIDSSRGSLLGSSGRGWLCAFLPRRSNAASRGHGRKKEANVLTRYRDFASREDTILTLPACILHVHVRHEHHYRCGHGSSAYMGYISLEHGVGRALKRNIILLRSSPVSIANRLVGSLR